MIKIKIPATSANLGVLYDKGGVALDIYKNTISLQKSNAFTISINGIGEKYLSRNKNNLVFRAVNYYYMAIGRELPAVSIEMDNEIPLSRGLGSSAACIAGGIFAANELEDGLLGNRDIIRMAAEMEGHGDNVCAAVTGGFTFFEDGGCSEIETGGGIGFILYIPEKILSTKRSRDILPKDYDYKTRKLAKNLESSMIKALVDGDYDKAGSLMEKDVIHQPYRKKLLPYWDDIVSISKKAGVWGSALSGAGPSMISMCDTGRMENIIIDLKINIDKRYNLNIIGCEIDTQGIVHG